MPECPFRSKLQLPPRPLSPAAEFETYLRLEKIKSGDQIAIFANEIRRLVDLAGYTGEGLEWKVRLRFVTNFPDHISVALRQLSNIKTAALNDYLCQIVSNGRSIWLGSDVGETAQT